MAEVIIAENQPTHGRALVWLEVVKTFGFLAAIFHKAPIDLPEFKMAVLASCGKNSTVWGEGDIVDDLCVCVVGEV